MRSTDKSAFNISCALNFITSNKEHNTKSVIAQVFLLGGGEVWYVRPSSGIW